MNEVTSILDGKGESPTPGQGHLHKWIYSPSVNRQADHFQNTLSFRKPFCVLRQAYLSLAHNFLPELSNPTPSAFPVWLSNTLRLRSSPSPRRPRSFTGSMLRGKWSADLRHLRWVDKHFSHSPPLHWLHQI